MPASAYEVFAGRSNARIVKLLDDNPEISMMVQRLLEEMVEHADRRGVKPKDLGIKDAVITPDGRFMGRIVLR